MSQQLDFAAPLPGIGVFGGIRRFLEIGNEIVRRGHRYTVYHTDGTPPDWMSFLGDVRPLDDLSRAQHQIMLCNDPALFHRLESKPAELKLFYFVLEGIREERAIARHPGWTILANSSGMANRLWRRYRVRAEPVVGGIDVELFRPRETSGNGEYRVLTFGRTSRPKKGVPIVLRAVDALARRAAKSGGPAARPVKLVLFDHIGHGNERDPRGDIRCDVPHEFHLNLPQEDLAALYSSCDVFVSAEKRAGWANTVAEAMACGVPVVCTRSGTRDLARHRETAWVARRNRWSLSRGLWSIYRDNVLADQFRRASFENIRSFTWERVSDRLLEVVATKLGRTPIP
jgi:glycosyltransferase involved in cell wall biosynthesis